MDEKTIKRLKAKYKTIYHVNVEDDEQEGGYDFVLKSPDRKTMSAVAKIGQNDPYASSEIMIKNCLVHGDPALLEDVTIFSAVFEQFQKNIVARKATIKKI